MAAEQPEQSFSAFPFTEVCNRNSFKHRDFPHLPKDGFQWTIKIFSHNREKGTLQLPTPKVPRESWELLLPRAAVRRQAELPLLPLLTLLTFPGHACSPHPRPCHTWGHLFLTVVLVKDFSWSFYCSWTELVQTALVTYRTVTLIIGSDWNKTAAIAEFKPKPNKKNCLIFPIKITHKNLPNYPSVTDSHSPTKTRSKRRGKNKIQAENLLCSKKHVLPVCHFVAAHVWSG